MHLFKAEADVSLRQKFGSNERTVFKYSESRKFRVGFRLGTL